MSSAEVPGAAITDGRRPPEAETVLSEAVDYQQQQPKPSSLPSPYTPGTPDPPMSKNALKRLRKQQAWDEGVDDRRKRRKEKRLERKVRVRSERDALIAHGVDPLELLKKKQPSTLVPVGIIIDCDFEDYMMDKERVSLSSQVTRAYSDNKQARYKSHLWISGFNKGIKKRFHDVLGDQHANWKGIWFDEDDYISSAAKVRERMRTAGGEMIPALQHSEHEEQTWARDEIDPFPIPGPEPPLDEANKDVVYLSSDSPYTLERLEPNTCYVIGGLVDKNREKGLCYRRARERGIRTARLPIGQFMVMQSRQVLATNHVVEIMLKWLECEDWGQAFLNVIPKRKGGRLREEVGVVQTKPVTDGEGDDNGEDEDGEEDEPAEMKGPYANDNAPPNPAPDEADDKANGDLVKIS